MASDASAAAAAASEALVAEFERLVQQASAVADLVDEVRAAADQFEEMVRDTLKELDAAASDAVHDATDQARAAHAAFAAMSEQFDTVAGDVRAAAVALTQSATDQIGDQIDEHRQMMSEVEKLAVEALETLSERLQSLLSDLRERFGDIDALWIEAQSATQTIHGEAKAKVLEFTGHLTKTMTDARTAGTEFVQGIETECFVPVEEALAEVEKLIGELGTRLFDKSLGLLTETVEDTVREEVGALIDDAIEAIKQMIKDKIDEIIKRRDLSEPERKALEDIFDALERLLGTMEDKVGSVKHIQAIVNF